MCTDCNKKSGGTKGCAFRIFCLVQAADFLKGEASQLFCPADITRSAGGRHGGWVRKAAPFGFHYMPCAGSTGEGRLMAVRFASQTKPSPEVPRLYGLSNSSSVQSKLIVQLIRHRADCVRPAETCEKSPLGFFRPKGSDQNAHINGRAFVQLKKQPHHRAHEEIQTHMPPEPYDRKPFGLYP